MIVAERTSAYSLRVSERSLFSREPQYEVVYPSDDSNSSGTSRALSLCTRQTATPILEQYEVIQQSWDPSISQQDEYLTLKSCQRSCSYQEFKDSMKEFLKPSVSQQDEYRTLRSNQEAHIYEELQNINGKSYEHMEEYQRLQMPRLIGVCHPR